ncbi:PREDICTED: translation initiation factor IF-2-like, partial [Chinchilla lanigera]|uniref:translation initiation factor IF-2-like n=1 Tax=Chinchilla lanigera TaxID=34839 RepID=UPI00069621F4
MTAAYDDVMSQRNEDPSSIKHRDQLLAIPEGAEIAFDWQRFLKETLRPQPGPLRQILIPLSQPPGHCCGFLRCMHNVFNRFLEWIRRRFTFIPMPLPLNEGPSWLQVGNCIPTLTSKCDSLCRAKYGRLFLSQGLSTSVLYNQLHESRNQIKSCPPLQSQQPAWLQTGNLANSRSETPPNPEIERAPARSRPRAARGAGVAVPSHVEGPAGPGHGPVPVGWAAGSPSTPAGGPVGAGVPVPLPHPGSGLYFWSAREAAGQRLGRAGSRARRAVPSCATSAARPGFSSSPPPGRRRCEPRAPAAANPGARSPPRAGSHR